MTQQGLGQGSLDHEQRASDHRSPVAALIARRHGRNGGSTYAVVRWAGAIIFASIVIALLVSLIWQSAPAFRHSGFDFIFSGNWDPSADDFGAGVFIIDTMITT